MLCPFWEGKVGEATRTPTSDAASLASGAESVTGVENLPTWLASCSTMSFACSRHASSSTSELRRTSSAKLDEQLDSLQALLPDTAAVRTFLHELQVPTLIEYSVHHLSLQRKERATVVLDAYRYIATLQRQVADLTDEPSTSSPLLDDEVELYCTWRSSSRPVVDVAKRTDTLLEVRIACANRPGLLVDIMEAIESTGLTITHTRIACHNDCVVEYLSLEVNDDTRADPQRVKTLVLNAIC